MNEACHFYFVHNNGNLEGKGAARCWAGSRFTPNLGSQCIDMSVAFLLCGFRGVSPSKENWRPPPEPPAPSPEPCNTERFRHSQMLHSSRLSILPASFLFCKGNLRPLQATKSWRQ